MVGLALVSAVAVLGASLKESVSAVVERSFAADFVLTSQSFQGFSPTVVERLREADELDAVLGVRTAPLQVGGELTSDVSGLDPAAAVEVLRVDVVDGDLASLDEGRLAVSTDVAEQLGLSVGDTVPATWAESGPAELVLGAVYEPNDFLTSLAVSEQVFSDNTSVVLLQAAGVTVAEGVSPEDARRAVDAAVADLPTITVEDQAEFVADQRSQIDQLLNVVLVLLVLSILIAVLGIVNTLALSVVERTRELGLLRAVGLQRRQLRRMIRIESVVIALYGAVLGVVVGTGFGWALVRALREQGITEFVLPYGQLAAVLVVAALAGVLAAALPARRAARLDVLQAVAST
jgi:putative ABC transport system permease protein